MSENEEHTPDRRKMSPGEIRLWDKRRQDQARGKSEEKQAASREKLVGIVSDFNMRGGKKRSASKPNAAGKNTSTLRKSVEKANKRNAS